MVVCSGDLRMSAAQRLSHRLDHYYWLTAFLAARGVRITICRVVAAVMFCLGAMPLALIGSSVGPVGPRDRLLAVIVAAAVWRCRCSLAEARAHRSEPSQRSTVTGTVRA